MEAYKNGSARQVFFNEFKINHSFTLENSFFKRYSERELQWQQEKLTGRDKKGNATQQVVPQKNVANGRRGVSEQTSKLRAYDMNDAGVIYDQR